MLAYTLCGAKPNVDGVLTGSKLIINGNGNLFVKGNGWGCGIGGAYSSYMVANIVINSGNIIAEGNVSGCGIGGGLREPVNNIIINGGYINSRGGYSSGIGSYSDNIDNIVINGGVLDLFGGEYGKALEGGKNLKINGGIINLSSGFRSGMGANEIQINGGTIKSTSSRYPGISCNENGKITILGGNIYSRGKNYNIATYEEGTSNLIKYIPNNGTNNIYETQIKLQNVEANKKIESITTSDSIEYGIKDMNTLEDGMLYLYLPLGKREITIKVDGKTYKGEVETKEESDVTLLNEI